MFGTFFRSLFISVVVLPFTAFGDIPVSGVHGRILISPACPAIDLNHPCDEKPYATALLIMDSHGRVLKRISTDKNGEFVENLAKGQYLLGLSDPGKIIRSEPQPFEVRSGGLTEVKLFVDVGIR